MIIYDYQDKNAIVIGGAKGIGKEVVQGIVNGEGNRHEVNEQFSTIIDDFGKIDVLINVAGVISAKSFDSLPPEEWVEQSKLT